ncbi:hypothetical protein [Plantactinospora soyae]|uniref:DNA repair exonuclease SbcCD ATPase subunit n=1 Tax=Plantactinospora soyae TaxID=1544732 RepID=A0A927M4N0_9ACTN|nr:hypothetical protein [Plantactinospora soyae]MBE1484390.1 DNA repair exonuclease SbcCD ATPase subunit [Plantactinospora soyae]
MTTMEVADPARSFRVLRDTLLAAARSLDEAVDERQVTLPLIAELDEALRSTPRLTTAIRNLLDAADPGRAVAGDLRRWSEDLVRVTEQLSAVRAELAEASATEAQLREAAAEAEREQGRIDELHRAERMAGRLDELRAARTALEAQHGAPSDQLAVEEEAFWPPLDQAIELIERLAGDLRAETVRRGRRAAELAGEVAAQQSELLAARVAVERSSAQIELMTTEIAAAVERQRQLGAELAELVQRHRRHAEADRLLAEAFNADGPADGAVPNIAEARTQLAAVEERLTKIDEVLREALIADEAQDRLRTAPIWPGGR